MGDLLVRGAIALSVIVGSGLIAAPAHADATRDAQWYLKTLKVADAHRLSQGEGITVAVIDTGVDANHPDLRGNVLPGINALDVNSPDKGTKDLKGHGTAMASLIAGHGHGPGNSQGVLGIAPKAKILPINVSSPKTALINTDMIADAIRYAAREGAQVICVALAGGMDHKQADAIDEARERGALVIAAAGNHSDGNSMIGWPAYYSKAVAVNPAGKDNKLDKEAVEGNTMDIAAPGADITMAKPGGGYFKASGSSPATAIVAGAAALIRKKYPDSGSNLFLNRLLLNTADQGRKGPDEYYGWGTLDLMASLTKEPPRLTPTPSPTDLVLPERPDTKVTVHWGEFIVAGLVLMLVMGGIVALIVTLLIRRSRRKALAGPPPPAPPMQSADQPPQPVPDTGEWRRPPGEKPDQPPPPGPPPSEG